MRKYTIFEEQTNNRKKLSLINSRHDNTRFEEEKSIYFDYMPAQHTVYTELTFEKPKKVK